jgi:hypothetical protein
LDSALQIPFRRSPWLCGRSLRSLSTLRFDLAAEVGKGCPPRIDLTCIAVAYLVVAITSASRAESFAFLLAERFCRQGEQHLLAQYVLNRKTASFIVPDFGIRGRDSVLRGVCVDTGGAKQQVKVFFEPLRDRIQAASAGHFEIAPVSGAQPDVMDLIVGSAMLCEEVGAAVHRHTVDLTDSGTVVDGAGRDRLTELNRLPFQIEHRNQ